MQITANVTGTRSINAMNALSTQLARTDPDANIVSIAQQSVMNRTSLGREMREIAAKRARRKSGTPTTISGKR